MVRLLIHIYQFAESYTVVLAWVVIPLFFFACYRFLRNHYGMFQPNAQSAPGSHTATTPQGEEQELDGAA